MKKENPNYAWDELKRHANIEKHSIDFQDAVEVFSDPDSLSIKSKISHEEDRRLIIGRCKDRIITVIFTWRNETVRLISARAARKEERQRYGP